MNNDLISVVVPVYNVEPYLKRCVDSIIGQSYKNIEIILVDDGSTDGSSVVCDGYLNVDDRIMVIHQENKGLSNARNTGIENAKGKYISFVDSDDYLDVNFIEILHQNIVEQGADIVVCDLLGFDSQTLEFSPRVRCIENGFIDVNHIFEMMMHSDYPWLYTMTCNKLYAKRIFEETRFKDGFIHEDEIIFLDIVKKSPKIYQIGNPLFYYCRGRKDSIINKKYSIKRLDILIAFYDRIEYFRKKGDKSSRWLIKNEQIKIFRKLKKALYKLSFDNSDEIIFYQDELKKAAKKCVHNFKCLKMYLSIVLSKEYRSVCQKKRRFIAHKQ